MPFTVRSKESGVAVPPLTFLITVREKLRGGGPTAIMIESPPVRPPLSVTEAVMM